MKQSQCTEEPIANLDTKTKALQVDKYPNLDTKTKVFQVDHIQISIRKSQLYKVTNIKISGGQSIYQAATNTTTTVIMCATKERRSRTKRRGQSLEQRGNEAEEVDGCFLVETYGERNYVDMAKG